LKRINSQRLHLPSLFQLLWSLLAASFFGAAALLFLSAGAAGAIAQWFVQTTSAEVSQSKPLASFLTISVGMLWLMLITLPSIVYSFKHLSIPPYTVLGKSQEPQAAEAASDDKIEPIFPLNHKFLRLGVVALPLVTFAVLGLGQLCSKQPVCGVALLPFFHILAVCLPIAWYITLGAYQLSSLRKRAFWSVLADSISLSPSIILVIEVLLFIIFAVAAGVVLYITLGSEHLRTIVHNLENAKDQEALFSALAPLLAQPGVIAGLLLLLAVFVPLIEEALKPLALWLILLFIWQGKRHAPERPQANGFIYGLVCGGGFALLESLFLSAGSANWAAVVGSRAAASLLHVVHGGLMGWAAGLAVESFKYSASWKAAIKGMMYFVFVYGWVVLIHGLWNGMTLLAVLADFAKQAPQLAELPLVLPLGSLAPFVLGAMILVQLLILLLLNRYIRRQLLKSVSNMSVTAV